MSALFAVATLMMVIPGSWGGTTVQEIGRFATLEHCEYAKKAYSLYSRKAEFFCLDGVVPK